MSQKYYQLGTHSEAEWDELHAELIIESAHCDHIPERCVECVDDQLHSPTRGTYLLTEQEAAALKNDPRVRFINLDYKRYPEYTPPSDELQSTRPDLLARYSSAVKNYREFSVSATITNVAGNLDATDTNRTGYQLYRCQQKLDPWVDGSLADNAVVSANISQYGTGRHVDVIVADNGIWIGHPEFQNNTVSIADSEIAVERPTGYLGGNLLPGGGTCDVLDLVLDAPYHLDPEWFDADPDNRLITRWDGTRVPVESVARTWWSNAAQRSAKFAGGGTVTITSSYTRANCTGSNDILSATGDHGTCCAALTYGRTQGWAYNANKWHLNLYGSFGSGIEQGFDLQKIFHQLKPVNPLFGTKNPTISSNSWGYRAYKDPEGSTWYYTHRASSNNAYTTNTGINWLDTMGTQGDVFAGQPRWKSEMKINSFITALDELIDAGVIFVAAAGNSNQKQVNYGHPDFNNYITTTNGGSLEDSSLFEFGIEVTGTTNRRGFPQQGGKYQQTEVLPTQLVGFTQVRDNPTSGGNTLTQSADILPGDLLVTVISGNGSNQFYNTPTVTGVGPWTEVLDQGVQPNLYVAYKTAVSADASYDQYWSWEGTQKAVITCLVFRNAVWDTIGAVGVGSGTDPVTAGAISTSAPNSRIIAVLASHIASAIGDMSAPWNPIVEADTGGGGSAGYQKIHQQIQSSSGAVSPTTHSVTTGTGVVGHVQFSIKPLVVTAVDYKTINIGALDDDYKTSLEAKVGYSDRGNGIDCYAPADGTLAANRAYPQTWPRPDTYENLTYNSGNATDAAFDGTSAACPVAAGFLATVLEWNRDWTWRELKDWILTLDVQDPTDFYYGVESTTPTAANWTDYESLEGGLPRVLYQGPFDARFRSGTRKISSGLRIKGLRIRR